MKPFLIASFLLISFYSNAQSIKPEQAKGYIGKTVTVCGSVVGTHATKSGTNFLDFGSTYPHEVFSAVISSKDIQGFGGMPVQMYSGKNICVTGRLELYQHKPAIIVHHPDQIK
jgi:DNA/RNA endonuclease YhcR with UshA esterase domain